MAQHSHIPHPDWPTFNDAIGWGAQLSDLASRIARCKAPQVFGIHGDWGAGKSSFARQLQFNLGGDPDPACDGHKAPKLLNPAATTLYKGEIVTVWFEAWRYQNEPVPVVALLHEIRRQLALSKKVANKFKKLGEVASRALLNSLSDIGKRISLEALPSGDKVQALGEQWEKDNLAQRLGTDSTSALLQDAINALLPESKLNKDGEPISGIDSRVVVIIDDLDRCNPDAAFKLLEGIKVYLSIPKCVFVIAMNETAIQEAIAKNLPSLDKTEQVDGLRLRAAHYLEKLCTNIYRLPEPADSHAVFSSFFNDEKQKKAIEASLATSEKKALPPNPRRLKALANQWRWLAANCWDETKSDDELKEQAAHLLVVAYVYQFHTALWQPWRFDPDFWRAIEDWVNGDKPKEGDWRKCFQPLSLPPNTLGDDVGAQDFLDPAASNIFWIASLIRANTSLFNARSFLPYLKLA